MIIIRLIILQLIIISIIVFSHHNISQEDGSQLYSASLDRSLKLWDLGTRRPGELTNMI